MNVSIVCEKQLTTLKTYLGGKFKIACEGAPIHSPKSRAFARDTLHGTIRVLISVCAETYLVREMTTSYVGPTSPPTSCASSAIKRPIVWTFLRCRHLREKTCHCGQEISKSRITGIESTNLG